MGHTEEMTGAEECWDCWPFLAVIVIQGYGCIAQGWSFAQIAALYVMFRHCADRLFSGSAQAEACQLFCKGATRVFAAAFAVGLAQSVVVLDEPGLHHGHHCPSPWRELAGEQERDPGAADHLCVCDPV